MNHPDEQELVLHLSDDAADPAGTQAHVRSCLPCRRRLEDLRRLVESAAGQPVPEPDAGFEERIWQYQRQHLDLPPARRPYAAKLLWAAAAAMVVLAFAIGRFSSAPTPGPQTTPSVAEDADRLLWAAAADQLRRSRLVLAELANVRPGDVEAVSLQQGRAAGLVANGRLVRASAQRAGHPELVGLLEEVERLLLDVSRAPIGGTPDDIESWRGRIQASDLLFKVTVAEMGARPSRVRPEA